VTDDNGWDQYKKLVTDCLQRNERSIDKLTAEVVALRSDLAALKVKSSFWGALGGLVSALTVLVVGVTVAILRS
jgi:hypothetical protein